ncbi:MAG: Xaa-Pro aminopeptidase [Candidatus Poriferisodalaceae bacterium]|jgi:Xaa-Pro aminopeptidase
MGRYRTGVDPIIQRQSRVAERWALSDEVVLCRVGEPVPITGSDQYHPFWAHPDVRYLAGTDVPGAVLAFDASDRSWDLFGPRLTPDELVWEQAPPPLGRPIAELDDWLGRRTGRRVLNVGADGDPVLTNELAEIRLHKDQLELQHLRTAATCSLAGFEWVYNNVNPGMTEREVQIGMEAEFFRAGAPRVAYDSIVAGGPNGAVLHFHPTSRVIEAGDLLLIDAGAQIEGYASDVSRTMVVGADPTDEQSFLWHLVRQAQELAIDRCHPGVEWRDVHLETARTIGSGLLELDLLRGEVDELVSSGAVALFFPHGLGHLIGLTVHDAGGYRSDRERSSHPQFRYLRTDRPLEAGMITSVEPGVYFIEALLSDPAVRNAHADSVVWERVDEFEGFGGIRIEDDIHITDEGPENLSGGIGKPLSIG